MIDTARTLRLCSLFSPEAWQKLNPADDVVVVTAAVLPKTDPPCPKLLLCPNTRVLLWPNIPPPVLADGCPKEKELALLVLEDAPNTLPLLEAAVEAAGWPKAGTVPNPDWLKVKPLEELLAGCPKVGAWPKAGWPKPPVVVVPNAEVPNPVLAVGVVTVAVVGCPNGADAVVPAGSWPKTDGVEGVAVVSPAGWLNAEPEELEFGGWENTEEPAEVATNTEAPTAGLWTHVGTPAAAVSVLAASAGEAMVVAEAASEMLWSCGTEAEAAGGTGAFSSLVEAGVAMASGGGATDAVLEPTVLVSPAAVWDAGGSLTGSESCICGCGVCVVGGEDSGASFSDVFSEADSSLASPPPLIELAAGAAVCDGLKRFPNERDVEAGRAEGAEVDVLMLLACWIPKEKLSLFPLEPARLNTPGEPVLVIWTLPKRLPVALVLMEVGAVPADVTDVEVASPAFPNIRGLPKTNPEGDVDALVDCAPAALVDGVLVVVLALSSAWPTRSPEKLPRVSPDRLLRNKVSPGLDWGISNLPEAVDGAEDIVAAGLFDWVPSAEELFATAAPEALAGLREPKAKELSGTAPNLEPPASENESGWVDSLAGAVNGRQRLQIEL